MSEQLVTPEQFLSLDKEVAEVGIKAKVCLNLARNIKDGEDLEYKTFEQEHQPQYRDTTIVAGEAKGSFLTINQSIINDENNRTEKIEVVRNYPMPRSVMSGDVVTVGVNIDTTDPEHFILEDVYETIVGSDHRPSKPISKMDDPVVVSEILKGIITIFNVDKANITDPESVTEGSWIASLLRRYRQKGRDFFIEDADYRKRHQ